MSGLADAMTADAASLTPVQPALTLAQRMAADATSVSASASPGRAPRGFVDNALDQAALALTSDTTTGKLLHDASGIGASVIGGFHGLGTLIGGLASGDDWATSVRGAANAVEEAQKQRTITPAAGSGAARVVDALDSPYNPANLPAVAGSALGNKVNEVSGSPALATVADVGTQLLGPGAALKMARVPLRAVLKPTAPAAVIAPRVEPTLEAPTAPQAVTPATVTPPGTPVGAQPVPEAPPTAVVPVPAKPVAAPVASDAANGIFAEAAPDVAGGVPASEQLRRATVLKRIGLEDTRKSAVNGNASEAATDFQASRLSGPSGELMKTTLANEKAAIANYADGITRDTGGSPMNDQSAKYARGGTIMAPLEALKDWFDNRTSALYKVADERAQGVPTELDKFRTVLGDDSEMTNGDRVSLRGAIQAQAKKLNIIREDGTIFSDAQQAETMRKYLNEHWSPQSSGFIGKLKDALDDDVTSAAGEDIYGDARAMRTLRGNTIDNPNGIAKLLDSSGPNQVNRKVPIERVADTVVNMPVDQLAHIVETLKKAPPEIAPQARAALAEIKAQYAHNVYDIGSKQAGQWNARGVRQYLDANSKRMRVVFEPEELQKFGTLNDAGNILAKDQSYPGAAAQHANLVRAGVSHGIQTSVTAIGGAIGGPAGGVVGSVVGGKLAGRFNDAAALRTTQKRLVKLSDVLDAGKPEVKP